MHLCYKGAHLYFLDEKLSLFGDKFDGILVLQAQVLRDLESSGLK